jgi:glycine/D-amino acid oxidase-like deaminating enzyme
MMSPTIRNILSDETIPASADVVIIGGGIVGASAAYFLARRRLSVALLEKGYLGCEQSSRNWGWCRRQNRDERELPLSGIAMRLWDEVTADIGQDLGFRRCGLIYATDDPQVLAKWEKWRETARPYDVDTRMLTAEEARRAVPGKNRRPWLGGIHSVDDGKAEPSLAAPLIAEGARRHGATLHQNCAARGLDFARGAVSGVVTEKGLIRTNAVLCSAGAWTSTFLRPHSVSVPQASVRQTTIRTGPAPDLGEAISTPGCVLTRRIDGSYTLAISGKATLELTPQGIRYARHFLPMFIQRLKSVQIGLGRSFFEGPEALGRWQLDRPTPFERIRVLDPTPDAKAIAAIKDRVRTLFPVMENVGIADSWGAYIDSTPDGIPFISSVAKRPGLFVATGCSGHGFGIGLGIGHLAADLVANDTPCVDPSPFRLSRFRDGTKVEVGDF